MQSFISCEDETPFFGEGFISSHLIQWAVAVGWPFLPSGVDV